MHGRLARTLRHRRPLEPAPGRWGRLRQQQRQQRRGLFGWLTGATRADDEAAGGKRKGGAGLPSPQEAQALAVVRLPNFLSSDEIAQIRLAASEIRRDGAGAVRLQSSPSMTTDGSLPSWDQEGYETDRGEWSTTYLQTERMFQNRLPELHQKAKDAAIKVDQENWGICAAALAAAEPGDALNTRVIEVHTVGPTGGLPAAKHYDSGSCITIDFMLSEPAAGGTFETLELIDGEEVKVAHEFRQGDAVVFPSHKYHCVQPVVEGMREVLIMEFWVGEERKCNHRCEQHFGHCGHVRMPWNNTTGSSVAW